MPRGFAPRLFLNSNMIRFNRKYFNSIDNEILYLKYGDLDEKLKEAKKPHQIFDLSSFFERTSLKPKK